MNLKEKLGNDIEFETFGGYELITPSDEYDLRYVEDINDLLRPYFKDDVFVRASHLIT